MPEKSRSPRGYQYALQHGCMIPHALPLAINKRLDFFLCQSLSAKKANAAVLHFHFIDISRLALDDFRPLALFFPKSDNDLFSDRKTCHKNLADAGYLLFISHAESRNDPPGLYPTKKSRQASQAHSGPMPSHENASINLWPGARERLMEGITKSHHGHECSARPKNILIIVAPTHLTTLVALNYQNKDAVYRRKELLEVA